MHNKIFAAVFLLLFVPSIAHGEDLKLGVTSNDVKGLQQALNRDPATQVAVRGPGSLGNESTYYGPATLKAIQKFQVKYGIVRAGASGYGVVGPSTLAKLKAVHGYWIAATPAASGSFEISGWIPYWKKASGTPEAIAHIATFKEINPFGYSVKNDGTLADTAAMTQEPWPALISAARANNVRIMPSVMWSDAGAIDRVLRDPKLRAAHIASIVDTVNANNFDGIDLDYEGKLAETRPYFTLFLRDLYKAMGKKWVSCTIEARTPLDARFAAVPETIEYANDFKALNNYCDRVKIMTYDQGLIDLPLNRANKLGGLYIPVSDPLWVEKVAKLAAETISRKKLFIGIPTYGYEYEVTPLANGYNYERMFAFNPRYAVALAAERGITPTRNAAGELSFAYAIGSSTPEPLPKVEDQAGVQMSSDAAAAVLALSQTATSTAPIRLLWWSDAQAIKDKVTLARKLGIRGVAVFKIDGGYDPGLWEALR